MATNTYVALKTSTVTGSAASTVLLDNIQQGYTDLIVVCNFTRSSGGNNLSMRINGDSGTNYSETYIEADGSTAFSNRNANTNAMRIAAIAGGFGTDGTSVLINLQNYSNATTYKTILTRYSQASTIVGSSVGLWRNTAAITSIELASYATANFAVGSTFTVYGIKAEGALAKATGGAIYSDSQYWYHLFPATGTFTPSQAISADVLLLAGGGGGGSNGGGGGGAGGLRVVSSQSLSSGVAYTCSIGSGGSGGTGGGSSGTAGTASSVSGSGFTTISASGGGYGTSQYVSGGSGGSGGGAGKYGSAGGAGNSGSYSPVEGYAGGIGASLGAGGGGGAGGVGTTGGTNGGAGGVGNTFLTTWFSALGIGINSSIAGGGGGGSDNTGGSATGGGGAGGSTNGNGTAAIANTGGGGGGGGTGGSAGNGAAGGSGIVVIRYAK